MFLCSWRSERACQHYGVDQTIWVGPRDLDDWTGPTKSKFNSNSWFTCYAAPRDGVYSTNSMAIRYD
ncbi:hypothetical protein HBI24_183850 [Parastagonospora nodorum]|nr:hypothetical protein HBI80_178750 [Parastagonospora nodorum]KAH5576696.1 hypothetical protein HBI24_183850 [Parastagonospora nodorum]